MTRKKLVLVYVDSLRTDMLEAAITDGRAPTFGRLVKRGTLIGDCVAPFPSVTPVASAEMVTGVRADRHWISGMNWYHRVEQRYVEYGSSLDAGRAFGLLRSLTDLVYNMNLAHLSPEIETVFETLDDREVRTASTPFLIYRGRHRHEVTLSGLSGRAIEAGLLKFHYGTWGPRELFYGELYASMEVPCRPSAVPGRQDGYSACCAAELVSRDRFDFMLLSFPDNDNYSHRFGPRASVDSIERADLCMAEVVRAGGGLDRFLADHAVILVADHAHSDVTATLDIIGSLEAEWDVIQPSEDRTGSAELAVSPTSRAANIYLLRGGLEPGRHQAVRERVAATEGVELVIWLESPEGEPVVRISPGHDGDAVLVVVVERDGRRLEFGRSEDLPSDWGETVGDRRGGSWSVRGDLGALGASIEGGRFDSPQYPDALGRLFSAMLAPHSGDIALSASLGYECIDWGGSAHLGGGSHGSLRREDSSGPLLFVGCGPDEGEANATQWAVGDVAPVIRDHFLAA